MLSRFLGTGVGHVSLRTTRPEADISIADTTPEPALSPSNDSLVSAEPELEDDSDHYSSDGDGLSVSGLEDHASDDEAAQVAREAGGEEDDVAAWEDDDETEPEDEDLLFDYDYGN